MLYLGEYEPMKKCPFCNAEMPEEAHICLNCLNICEETQTSAIISQGSKKRFAISKRTLSNIITAAICVFVVMPCMILPQLGSFANQGAQSAGNTNGEAGKGGGSIISRITTAIKETLGIDDDSAESPAGDSSADTPAADGYNNPTTPDGENGPSIPGVPTAVPGTTKPASGGSSTTKPTEAATTVKPEDETIPEGKVEYDKWEYTENNGKLTITKYTGSAKTVVIPEKIDGKIIGNINENTFLENNTMQYAVFQDFTTYHNLWVHYHTFYKCGNLKKIVFPKNADLGILDCFAAECYSLYDIQITNYQYKFVDGALVYYNTKYWQIYYYCEGYKSDTFTYPEYVQVSGTFELFKHTKNLKYVYLSSEMTTFLAQYDTPYLESVYAKNNSHLKDINGVLYELNKNGKWAVQNYPNNNKAAEFTMPENSVFKQSNLRNSNLKTLKIPANVEIDDYTLKHICRGDIFPNLQTVYIESGSSYLSYIKSTFTGKVIVY